jgi:hypothetical protein
MTAYDEHADRGEYWAERERLKAEFLEENDHAQLFDLTAKAKAPLVVSIREQWKSKQWMSDKQAAVLAGWLAEQEVEYGD